MSPPRARAAGEGRAPRRASGDTARTPLDLPPRPTPVQKRLKDRCSGPMLFLVPFGQQRGLRGVEVPLTFLPQLQKNRRVCILTVSF